MAGGVSGYYELTNGWMWARVYYSETYDVTTNSSVVTIDSVKLMSTAAYGWIYYLTGSVAINGTTLQSFRSSYGNCYCYVQTTNAWYDIGFNPADTWGSVSIPHDEDGAKNITISVNITGNEANNRGYSGWNVSGSSVFPLTTIPRKSELTVDNGTLGSVLPLKVNRKSDSFTHTITYTCGSVSGTVCSKSGTVDIKWTPLISLASQNPAGTSVTITLKIETFDGDSSIGSNSYKISCAIPTSYTDSSGNTIYIRPGVSISVSDPTGHATTYGGYIKGVSKFKIDVTAAPSYGSPINSYKVSANGVNYTTNSVTTDIIKSSGELTISASATDKRNRTGSVSTKINVLEYTAPKITSLSVHRCNEDGTENGSGEFIKVTYSGSVTSLNNKNSAAFTLEYKKTSATSYGEPINLPETTYNVSNGTYIFAAESGASYSVRVTAVDNFGSGDKSTSASTAVTIMHFLASGLGMAIGKIAELTEAFEVGWNAVFYRDVNVHGTAYAHNNRLVELKHAPNYATLPEFVNDIEAQDVWIGRLKDTGGWGPTGSAAWYHGHAMIQNSPGADVGGSVFLQQYNTTQVYIGLITGSSDSTYSVTWKAL